MKAILETKDLPVRELRKRVELLRHVSENEHYAYLREAIRLEQIRLVKFIEAKG